MTDTPPALPKARVKPASNWSAIWVLPIIALLIGGWLGWKAYTEAGVVIDIQFDGGDGLQAGKTELFYKGIALGKVQSVNLDQKTQKVHVSLEVDRHAEDFLREKTIFWLVKPNISLAGVTGLETLVSGNYIAISPGEGKPRRKFIALSDPPPLADALPGLHLKLRAKTLGSLTEGSPVYYRHIQVGSVTGYALDNNDQSILIKAHIRPEYAQLVNAETRFWNASGFSVTAGLSGVKVDVESLLSVAVGGIAFDNDPLPPGGFNREASKTSLMPLDYPSHEYPLFENYQDAQTGVSIDVELPNFAGLEANKTQVRWNGFPVGLVKGGKVSKDLKSFMAELDIDPRAKAWLTEDAAFWLVQPEISLNGIRGFDALLRGNYLEFKPGALDKPARRQFTALSGPPAINFTTPGLHLILTTKQAASLKAGSPVMFRQLVVGSITNVTLTPDHQEVRVGVLINPEYSQLVNSSSRFWNASGVTLSGGFSGFEVRSESLAALVNGGIAFETPEPKAAAVHNGSNFALHADQASATRVAEMIELEVLNADGLRAGTPVRYRGFQVGEVNGVELSADLKTLKLQIMLTQAAARIARQGSTFTVIRPELSLMKAANLDTLITGPYIEVQPASNPAAGKQTRFKGEALVRVEAEKKAGLNLSLSTLQRKSLKAGMAVTYRGMAVGTVTDLELSPDAASVLVHIQILPRYGKLVYSGSKFWNESGLNVDFSLFKGAQVRTDSVESLLQGSIAFATPAGALKGAPAHAGQVFDLHPEAQDEWLQWRPRFALDR
ncbi:PqiB family protein [Pseudomonas sp. N040]|uniref:PqiB family protein n=1 Tax=Pseudomonas sp. N040 TaxID=2785325 RepID=UPI0018A28AF7|nr:MlaD family protein [Pseudomonas sp. N040]MBF7728844.1 MCE family protein [Pseudomonas sp. N040]MBW7012484.1 MlaD family protein [Pseudomonas sp. N040]